jgi:hypothetical protein
MVLAEAEIQLPSQEKEVEQSKECLTNNDKEMNND